MLDILNPRDGILMQEQHFEFVMVVEALNLSNTVAFKPKRCKVLVCLQVFNFGKTFVMEIEGIVKRGSLKLPIRLAQFVKISLTDVDLTVFISIRLNVDPLFWPVHVGLLILTSDGVLKLLAHVVFVLVSFIFGIDTNLNSKCL